MNNSMLTQYCGQENEVILENPDPKQSDWIDRLIEFDWSSGKIPEDFIKFGTPIVRMMWDQTHTLVRNCFDLIY